MQGGFPQQQRRKRQLWRRRLEDIGQLALAMMMALPRSSHAGGCRQVTA
jgi:hypothetical protein